MSALNQGRQPPLLFPNLIKAPLWFLRGGGRTGSGDLGPVVVQYLWTQIYPTVTEREM